MAFAATIGFFDGVHKGHRFLLNELLRKAAESGLQSAVLTLDTHPQAVLSGQPQSLLTTPDERAELLKQTGVDEIFLFRFDVIQQMTAAEFLHVLYERCGVQMLLMGYDHRFGSDRLTDFADYAAIGEQIGVQMVPVAASPEGAVSSSKIRQALQLGDMEHANDMLGYPYTLSGVVVRGNGLGHTIGFPTANLQPDPCKLIPATGVYAAEAVTLGPSLVSPQPALVNIGNNPTVGNDHLTIEAYLPSYQGGDMYGETLTLRFLRRIRDERKFASLEELRAQIHSDLAQV